MFGSSRKVSRCVKVVFKPCILLTLFCPLQSKSTSVQNSSKSKKSKKRFPVIAFLEDLGVPSIAVQGEGRTTRLQHKIILLITTQKRHPTQPSRAPPSTWRPRKATAYSGKGKTHSYETQSSDESSYHHKRDSSNLCKPNCFVLDSSDDSTMQTYSTASKKSSSNSTSLKKPLRERERERR